MDFFSHLGFHLFIAVVYFEVGIEKAPQRDKEAQIKSCSEGGLGMFGCACLAPAPRLCR